MATVLWLGLQGVVRKQYRWTVNAAAGTYTLTHNLKSISYTYVTGDAAADIVAGLVAAAVNSPEPEWAELSVDSYSTAVVGVTGPDDGATFTVTASVTGSATMTAANQVDLITFNATATGGNLQLTIQKTDGSYATTGNAAWNATDATFLSNINTALDAATGIAGGIVATGAAPDDAITLTYSGTGYAGSPWRRATVAVFPTSVASATYSNTTAAGVAPVSPHDVADNANYSGSLANNDTLVIPAGSADMRYNLEAKNNITGLTVIREAGGPSFGLPDYRATGYREYRALRLKFPATTATINTTVQDGAGAMRLHLSSATCAMRVTGEANGGGAGIGDEVLEVIGSGNSSTLAITNSSVAVAPLVSTTAGFTTIVGDNSTVNLGSGVTTVTDEFTACTVQIACNWTTLTAAGAGTLTVLGTATGALIANQGTVNWNGTGALASPEIGADVLLDLAGGSAAVAVTGQIVMYDGAVLNDPGSRITVPFSVYRFRCPVEGLNVGRHRKVTVDTI
jgi:hypothetical protein